MSDSASDKPAEKTAPSAGKSAGGMLPAIIAVVLAPVLSWVVVSFVIIPKLTKEIKSELTTIMAEASKRDGTQVEGRRGLLQVPMAGLTPRRRLTQAERKNQRGAQSLKISPSILLARRVPGT